MSMVITKKPPEYLREARIRAGYVNRGTAAMVVPYSPETIGRHERGDIEMEPEDAVVYADCYNEPGIMARYCATCPVGQRMSQTARHGKTWSCRASNSRTTRSPAILSRPRSH